MKNEEGKGRKEKSSVRGWERSSLDLCVGSQEALIKRKKGKSEKGEKKRSK